MNRLYMKYIEYMMENGVVELEEFLETHLDFARKLDISEVEEFFEIVYENILEGIYTKGSEIGLSEEQMENIADEEYRRISDIRDRFIKLLHTK